MSTAQDKILNILREKSSMKQRVFDHTLDTFRMLKEVAEDLVDEYTGKMTETDPRVNLAFNDRGLFQCELKFAGDLIVFSMHSNVFEFDRAHGVWKTSYVQDNSMSSYCGIINIYNFLADSFNYDRMDDLGYLIGRIFINKDLYYFMEGKRQLGYLYNNFGESVIDKEALKNIVESSMLYCLDFDLLVPPYDEMKILTVGQIHEKRVKSMMVTGKRLGFKFGFDDIQNESIQYSGG